MKANEPLFDVVAVNIETYEERHIDTNKTERNAEAIITMCIMRLGCDSEFYKTVQAGTTLVGKS